MPRAIPNRSWRGTIRRVRLGLILRGSVLRGLVLYTWVLSGLVLISLVVTGLAHAQSSGSTTASTASQSKAPATTQKSKSSSSTNATPNKTTSHTTTTHKTQTTTGHTTSQKTKSKTTHSKKTSKNVRSSKKRGQQVIDSTRATEIQQALIREHYLQGEPSGKWDAATQEAMQRFQADQGWQSKTTPDSRALIKLGLGPSHDHLLNPESAMTQADPKSAAKPAAPAQSDPVSPTDVHPQH